MKTTLRIFTCILLIAMTLTSLSSCADPYIEAGASQSTYSGISINVVRVDYSTERPTLEVEWSNSTLYEVVYGAYYVIERFDDGEWINCMKDDIGFIEIAYVLDAESKTENRYSLKNANISKEGLYRIRTECYVHEGEENSEHCSLYATFTVEYNYTF